MSKKKSNGKSRQQNRIFLASLVCFAALLFVFLQGNLPAGGGQLGKETSSTTTSPLASSPFAFPTPSNTPLTTPFPAIVPPATTPVQPIREQPSLLAAWRFDEIKEGKLLDSAPSVPGKTSLDIKLKGTKSDPVLDAGKGVGIFAKGLRFEDDDYVDTGFDIADFGGGKLTFSFWAKPEFGTILSKLSASTQAYGWEINFVNKKILGADYVSLAITAASGEGATTLAAEDKTVLSGSWHHFAIVLDSSSNAAFNGAKLFIDGKQAALKPAHTGLGFQGNGDNSANLVMGAAKVGEQYGSFYKGDIDELQIYERQLSEGEVKQIYEWAAKAPPVQIEAAKVAPLPPEKVIVEETGEVQEGVEFPVPEGIKSEGLTGLELYYDEGASAVSTQIDVQIFDSIPEEDAENAEVSRELPDEQEALKVFEITPAENIDQVVNEAEITFVLTPEELAGLDPNQITLTRFESGGWIELPTEITRTFEDGSIEFKALTPGFSVFVVAIKSRRPAPQADIGEEITNQTGIQQSTLPQAKKPLVSTKRKRAKQAAGLPPVVMYTVVLLVAAAAAGFIYLKKVRKKSATSKLKDKLKQNEIYKPG